MVLFPEKEKTQVPEGVEPRPEVPEIPKEIERAGVTTTPTSFTAQVTDNKGQNVIQPTTTTLQVPADTATLTSWSKGGITSSLTWFAAFWLRMIKKAVHFGVRIITGNAATS